MYHLTNRFAVACALLLAVLATAPARATVIGGAIADPPPTAHTAPDIVIDLLSSFVYAPLLTPTPPYTFTANQVGGPLVVDLSIASDRLFINPREGTEGVALIEVTADDADAGSFTVQFKVEITNAPPTLAGISNQTIDEGVTLALNAAASDADGPADTLSYSLDTAPPGATISSSTGAFSWTPSEADGPGSYPVVILVKDSVGATDTEGFNVDVNDVNEPPVLAAIPAQSVNEGSPLTFTASASDADLPVNTLTWSLTGTVPTGASINPANGAFAWTPTEAQGPAVVNIDVQVADGQGGTDTQTVAVTVNEVNEAPVLAAIAAQEVDEGSPLTFTASATDVDDPANTLTYSLTGPVPTGASINPTSGLFSWTPTEAQGPAVVNINVQVDDGQGGSDTQSVAVTVNEINEPPVLAAIGDKSVDEGNLLTFTASGSDPSDIPTNGLSYSLGAGAPAGATINAATGEFTWTPTEAQGPGSYPVTVVVTDDGTPALTASATITVTVNEVNEPPVLDPVGDRTIGEGNLLQFTVTATDPDLPPNGLNFSFAVGSPPGASLDPGTGLFSWTPTEAQGPGSYPVTIQVTDVDGLTDAETITITVNEVNEAPVLAVIAPQSVDEGSPLTFTASATDVDLPANSLTYSLTGTVPTGASIDPASGLFSWTPSEAQGPAVVNIDVQVDDGQGGIDVQTVAVTVSEVNEAPALGSIGDQTVDEGSTLSFTAAATDADDPANTLTYTLDGGAPVGASIDPVSGLFSWTPAEDQQGPHTLTVRVTDNGVPALNDFETITITVNEVNDAPVLGAVGDQTIDEETLLSFTATATDADIPANTLTYSLSGAVPAGAAIDPVSGLFSWTPAEADGPGTFSLTVVVTDNGTPALDDAETITITVVEINDAPFLIPGGDVPDQTMNEDDSALNVEVRSQFDDPDLGDTPPDTLTVVALPGYDASLISVTPNGNGVDVTPLPHRYGSTTVTAGVEDAAGVQATDTFVVDVISVNDPVQVDAGIADQGAPEDIGTVSVSLAGAFSDADLANGGDSHTVTFTSSNTKLLTPTNSPLTSLGGTMTFNVKPNANGVATITVVAEDAAGTQATTTFTLTISEVTDPPFVASPIADQVVAEDSGTLNVSLTGVFDDPDLANGDVQNYSVSHDNGTLITNATIAGSVLALDFGADQNGTANVTVTVTDISGNTAADTFVMNVTAVNDAPTVANPIADINTAEDDPTTFTIDLAAVFQDVDIATNGDVLTFSLDGNDNPGLFDVATFSGSVITLHLAPDQFGVANFAVSARDAAGESASDSFTVNVASVNDLPVAADDAPPPINEDSGPITIAVLANDYLAEQPTIIVAAGDDGESEGDRPTVLDPFGDPVQLDAGTVTIVGDQIQYEPAPDFHGTDYFTYVIEDSDGDRATGTVTISVLATNDAPVGIQERTFNMFENGTLTVDAANGTLVGGYDIDGALLDGSGNPVGSPLLAVLTVPPPVGSLNFDGPTGAFQFVPPINFTGEVSFLYRLFDGDSLSEGTDYSIRVIINPTPPPPTLPSPGQVAVTHNIANVPLEQTTSVPPNVLVVMDDSGSMDWNMVVSGADENGGFVLDNTSATKGKKSNISSFVYLWDLPTNAYPASSQYGLVLPTDEALVAADAGPGSDSFIGNEYGLWRARNHLHNTLYYNPGVYYRPWIGQDANNLEFGDAIPEFVRLDPVDPTNTFDITALHSYKASQVPEWDNNGGTATVDVTVYIPHYWAAPPPRPADPAEEDPAVDYDNPVYRPIVNDGRTFPGGDGREDCADKNACSYDEEIQNFANWFQYYRTREYVTKGSIGNVISQIQDIRVGYETISATTSEPVRDMNYLYTEGNKKLLLDNVYAVDSFGGTPLRQALGRAGQIFSCKTGSYCPALPAPDGQCQNNFALLFTDGYWNGGAGVPSNDDIAGPGPFDGGRYADNVNATLADVAMYYYENDLQTSLANEVPLSQRDLIGVPDGTFADGDTMHQHMKTFAIAFGVTGSITPDEVPSQPESTTNPVTGLPFTWTDPFDGPKEKIDDLLHAATNGRGDFLNAGNPQELQAAFETVFLEFTQAASSSSAAAFNSTSLRNDTLLYRGFYDLRDNTGELTATVVNPDGTLAPTPVWWASKQLNPPTMDPGTRVLVTSHSDTGDGIPFSHASLSVAQQIMMSEAEVDFIRGDRSDEGVIMRERPAVDGLLGDIVNSSPIFVGPPLGINRDQAPFPEDDLYSSFALAKASRNPVVYVGANDGILHGFDADLGVEVFGYVPSKIIDSSEAYHNDLEDFASPFYQHKYYVDLTPSLNDVYARPSRSATGKEWMTMLIGGLGGGGKGFFALNVTNPGTQYATDTTAATSVLWEFTDEDDTVPLDATGNPLTWVDPAGRPVKDLGYAHSQPTLVMSNASDGGSPARNEWVAVFGNGLNSTAGIAKLFVLFVDRGTDGWDPGDFVKVDTGVGVPLTPHPLTGYPNGVGEVTAVDVDLNGTVDWVYGGDRLGNLYRFDLSDPDPANWTSTRLFTASYDDGSGNLSVQPIMSKPVVSKHPTEDGFLITFGTGSYVTREDGRSQDVQSIYTIWDRGEANPATAQPDTRALRLVEQVITNVVDDSVSPFVTRRIVTENPVDYVSEGATPGVYGWYVDLDMPRATSTISGGVNPDVSGQAPPAPQFPGEKAIRRMIFRDGNIIVTTVLPSGSGTSCFGARPGSILLFNALTGGNPNVPIVDFNNDGYVDNGDLVEIGGEFFAGGILFDQDALDGSLVDPSILGGQGDTDWLFLSGGNETVSFRIRDVNDNRTGRLSWQELN